jgi:hydrogenase maturation protein HypF
MTAVASQAPVRHRVRVAGVVQGVGFRPFVHRLATELELSGHVGNDSDGVFAEVEGRPPDVEQFLARLVEEAPPLARVYGVEATAVETLGGSGFRIVASHAGKAVRTFVSADVATCDECLAELHDPADRRYRYPFINCTNCGPRFTITIRLPYDRPNTTMGGFTMCCDCGAEYHDPADRRFHAQPVACPSCGPRISFEGTAGVFEGTAGVFDGHASVFEGTTGPFGGHAGAVEGTDAAIAATQDALDAGRIVAIKGLGGYHLACDATSRAAVETLRRRKARADKPFAVMVRDLAAARQLAVIEPSEAVVLTSPERPIVLLDKRDPTPLTALVAPSSPYVGVLLPYTPLHHLLFEPVPGALVRAPRMLVMTSGNLSDEPICHEDADARRRLRRIADAWLVHDRPIHVPCDDSVVRVEAGEELPIRRSRGHAPLPVRLPFDSVPLMAVGGELKNTFCLAAGRNAWMSQHIGDMGSLETLSAFERSNRQFAEIYHVDPERVAADAHPGYQTRRWAEGETSRHVELVQHHHAHIAAVMVEHAVPADERVIGYAFDGTGYGTDGAIWGGEILLAGYGGFERSAHLRYVPLPGGDTTIRKPYRAALAHLWAAGIEWAPDLWPVRVTAPPELAVLERQLERGVQCVPTSSMGRLFDAVSSLLGVRHTVSYEAQAAIELETVAASHHRAARDYRFAIVGDEIDAGSVLHAIVDDLRDRCPTGEVAAGFHVAVAYLIAESAERLREKTGIRRVALSGGVFQNALLLRLARAELARRDLQVLTHRLVPPNDGGLALGQAAVAGYTHPGRTEA